MFNALLVTKDDESGKTTAAVTQMSEDQLPAAEVTVAVEYSTVNYKDGLCIGPGGGLVRTYPHVPGIDFAGIDAAGARFAEGGDEKIHTRGAAVALPVQPQPGHAGLTKEFLHQPRQGARRGTDQRQVDVAGHVLQRRIGLDAEDLLLLRVDRIDAAGELVGDEIFERLIAALGGVLGGADHGDRSGTEKTENSVGHGATLP